MIKYKKQIPKKFYSGGFLYNPETASVFIMQRDNNTDICPNMWGLFGGLNEEGETPEECFIRELEEESGLKVIKDNIYLLDEYLVKELDTYRYSFFVINNQDKSKFTLGEGQGFDWIPIKEIFDYNLCPRTKRDLKKFCEKLENSEYKF